MENNTDFYMFAMECKDCGWDWIGGFFLCPNCGSNRVNLIEETDEKMFERMYWISVKNIKGFYIDTSKALESLDRYFGIIR